MSGSQKMLLIVKLDLVVSRIFCGSESSVQQTVVYPFMATDFCSLPPSGEGRVNTISNNFNEFDVTFEEAEVAVAVVKISDIVRMSDSTTPQSLLQQTCPRAQSYTQATGTHTRAGALTFPSSCLDGGVTRVGPGQNPQYTRAWSVRKAMG